MIAILIRSMGQSFKHVEEACPTKYITFSGSLYFVDKVPGYTFAGLKTQIHMTIILAIVLGVDRMGRIFKDFMIQSTIAFDK